jgi:hypothetical protein
VFMPLGYTTVGPLSDAIGVDPTLLLAAGIGACANLAILLVPAVRTLSRVETLGPETPLPAGAPIVP